ncbi:LegC family aminotransferase [Chloroflexota bacterium]
MGGNIKLGIPTTQRFIPLCVPEIRGNEWKYIKECLDTNWVSSVGSFVDRFEQEFATYVGTEYAVATCNGTAALHIALLVAGVEPDDEVLVPTLTFVAPANAVRYVGAWPVFMDIEPDYWQMDSKKVVVFLQKECQWQNNALYNRMTGRRVRAILPVHIMGHPVDMDPILNVARKYNLVVIEDATESLGTRYKDRMVGHLGDIACFSFNGNKIITTGNGGMIVTDNETWANKAKYLTTQAKDDPVEYIHDEIGYNYRLSNIPAAMGCAQMEQIEKYIIAKRTIATIYSKQLASVPGITTMDEAPWAFSIFWMYTILVDETRYGMESRTLMRYLNEDGIQTRPLWQPLHCSAAHKHCNSYQIEIVEKIQKQALSIPSSVGLSLANQSRVIETIIKFQHQ